jgi:hypothetical protein
MGFLNVQTKILEGANLNRGHCHFGGGRSGKLKGINGNLPRGSRRGSRMTAALRSRPEPLPG